MALGNRQAAWVSERVDRSVAGVTKPRWFTRQGVLGFCGLIGPLIAAAGLALVRARVPNTDAALVLVVVVVAVAVASNGVRSAGTLAALSSAVWFDFFLTEPFYRFAISRREDVQTATLLLIVGLAVTEIAVRSARHRRTASEEAGFVALINSMAVQASSPGRSDDLLDRVAAELIGLLHLRGARYQRLPSRASRHPTLQRDGHLMWGEVDWAVPSLGFPNETIELPLRADGSSLGRFLLSPEPGMAVSQERLVVAGVLADQAAAVLARRPRALIQSSAFGGSSLETD